MKFRSLVPRDNGLSEIKDQKKCDQKILIMKVYHIKEYISLHAVLEYQASVLHGIPRTKLFLILKQKDYILWYSGLAESFYRFSNYIKFIKKV